MECHAGERCTARCPVSGFGVFFCFDWQSWCIGGRGGGEKCASFGPNWLCGTVRGILRVFSLLADFTVTLKIITTYLIVNEVCLTVTRLYNEPLSALTVRQWSWILEKRPFNHWPFLVTFIGINWLWWSGKMTLFNMVSKAELTATTTGTGHYSSMASSIELYSNRKTNTPDHFVSHFNKIIRI